MIGDRTPQLVSAIPNRRVPARHVADRKSFPAIGNPPPSVFFTLHHKKQTMKTPTRSQALALRIVTAAVSILAAGSAWCAAGDYLHDLQKAAVTSGRSEVGHWGIDPDDYVMWSTHSTRLIPVYTFGTKDVGKGVDLEDYLGRNSVYRKEAAIRRLYGKLPENTLNPEAEYGDQTNLYDLQRAAVAAGKKHIFLVVFDGMDWQMTRAAAIYAARNVGYSEGRGTGLHFLDYAAGGATQYGFVVTAPHNEGTTENANTQTILNPGGKQPGGYDALRGGPNPWRRGADSAYLLGRMRLAIGDEEPKLVPGIHCYPDSSATATSLTAGIKTFNGAINVDANAGQVPTIAHRLQDAGWSVGVVTSVPISHATPACAYAHNVARDDYQDLSRDLLGQKSIAHPKTPLPGMDVVIGGGFGATREKDAGQGENFLAGGRYLAEETLAAADVRNGGRYTVAQRTAGVRGIDGLREATKKAIAGKTRLLGLYGVGKYEGHLPFATADGGYNPAPGRRAAPKIAGVLPDNLKAAEQYTRADVEENPTLAEMTGAAIEVLRQNQKGFWLMMEAGDVDWGMHDDNLDTAIGAVISGDKAVRVITDWVDTHSDWRESLLIVTADHGHFLNIRRPELLIPPESRSSSADR